MTKRARGELLTGIGWLAGWVALTVYVVTLWGSGMVWLSAGLLLIGISGIRPLGLLLWHGLNFLPGGDE